MGSDNFRFASALEKGVNVAPPHFGMDKLAVAAMVIPLRVPNCYVTVHRPTETSDLAAKANAAPHWKKCRHAFKADLLFGSHTFLLVGPGV